MRVVSPALCEELSQLWGKNEIETYFVWVMKDGEWVLTHREKVVGSPVWMIAPDLDFILDSLPPKRIKLRNFADGRWSCQWTLDLKSPRYVRVNGVPIVKSMKEYITEDVTAVDAAARLKIELLKEEIEHGQTNG